MMTEHEPWKVFEWGDSATGILFVSVVKVTGEMVAANLSNADAKRIVACVNACAGIRTEVLEKGIVKHLLHEAFRKTINPFDYVKKREQDMT